MKKRVIIVSGILLTFAFLIFWPLLRHVAFLPTQMGWGLIGIALFMILSVLSGKIDRLGSLTGGIIALCLFLGTGFTGLILLLFFFVAGSMASHWKRSEKQKMGLEQENKGQRSYTHALANGGVAAICGYLAWVLPPQADLFGYMMAASFASAMADTLSSELGNVYGSKYWNILSWKPEPKGLDGVISWEGSLAGALGSIALAMVYGTLEGFSLVLGLIILAGVLGGIFDSILGATLQRKGYLSNGMVNFWNTAFGAGFVALISLFTHLAS